MRLKLTIPYSHTHSSFQAPDNRDLALQILRSAVVIWLHPHLAMQCHHTESVLPMTTPATRMCMDPLINVIVLCPSQEYINMLSMLSLAVIIWPICKKFLNLYNGMWIVGMFACFTSKQWFHQLTFQARVQQHMCTAILCFAEVNASLTCMHTHTHIRQSDAQ